MEHGRRNTPVQIIFFQKKAPPAAEGRPVVPQARQEAVTVEVPIVDEVKATKGKKKRGRAPKPEETARGLAQLATLGHELFSSGRVQEARTIYEGLVVSSPDDAFCHTMLGTICLAQNDQDRALGLFDRAIELDPTDLAALVYRGELKLNRSKTRQAIDDLEAALKVAPAQDPFADRAKRLLKVAKARKDSLKMR